MNIQNFQMTSGTIFVFDFPKLLKSYHQIIYFISNYLFDFTKLSKILSLKFFVDYPSKYSI